MELVGMTLVNRKVLDISHHNTVSNWQSIVSAGVVGIIHKATEGTSYVDAQYKSAREQAKKVGLLWGAYHFATASNAKAQVDHFLGTAGVSDDMLYALDWEDYGSNSMNLDQAREFLQRCDGIIGPNRTVLYSGNTVKEALGSKKDSFFGSHRLWLAQYGSSPTVQASWNDWWLWQYSDGSPGPTPHGRPGVNGNVDTASYEGSDRHGASEWSGLGEVYPPDEKASVEITTTGEVAVYVNGKLIPA